MTSAASTKKNMQNKTKNRVKRKNERTICPLKVWYVMRPRSGAEVRTENDGTQAESSEML